MLYLKDYVFLGISYSLLVVTFSTLFQELIMNDSHHSSSLAHCSHDHKHDHDDHHGHEHGPNCQHAHEEPVKRHERFPMSEIQLEQLSNKSDQDLLNMASEFVALDEFGKALPVFEFLYKKMKNQKDNSEDFLNLRHQLALVYGIVNEHANALPLWSEMVDFHSASDDPVHQSAFIDASFALALSQEHLGLWQDFENTMKKALSVAEKANYDEEVANLCHELGDFYRNQNRLQEAFPVLEVACKLREKFNDVVGLSHAFTSMGFAYFENNEQEKASGFWEKALHLSKDENFADELADLKGILEEQLSILKNASLKNKLTQF